MKTLRRSLAIALLTLLLVVPTFAGEMGSNVTATGEMGTPVNATGEMGTNGVTSTGEMGTGATLANDSIKEIALNLLQGMLSLF